MKKDSAYIQIRFLNEKQAEQLNRERAQAIIDGMGQLASDAGLTVDKMLADCLDHGLGYLEDIWLEDEPEAVGAH